MALRFLFLTLRCGACVSEPAILFLPLSHVSLVSSINAVEWVLRAAAAARPYQRGHDERERQGGVLCPRRGVGCGEGVMGRVHDWPSATTLVMLLLG